MSPIILVVDDSSVDRQVVGGLLKKQTPFEVEFAWDGDDAIDRLNESRVDVVVTDLIMPGMDGLELVEAMGERFPQVPVLLMTAYGNEDIAAEALEKGAASYVPKSQLAERLVPAVKRLVNRSVTDRCRSMAGRHLAEGYFRFEIENDLHMIESVVNVVQRTMSSLELGNPSYRIRACTALEEAISNAIIHGNLEIDRKEWARLRREASAAELDHILEQRGQVPPYRDRKVALEVHFSRQAAKFIIRDQGQGFDLASTVSDDLLDCFERGNARGLILMHSLVDDISFNESANEVTMGVVNRSGPSDDDRELTHATAT